MEVIILKLQGETGLRKPGTSCDVPRHIATSWIEKGYAVKEEKITLETKEEKFKVKKETKRRKPKQ